MSKITIIGDVHGKTERYLSMVDALPKGQRSIQIGDMGLGFRGVFLPHLPEQHKFFRGNHDAPANCRQHPNYLGDWGHLWEDNLFWIAGAFSIDRAHRTEGTSWWADEELAYQELGVVYDAYTLAKPEIVLSHDCPAKANQVLLRDLMGSYFAAKGGCITSRTCQALQNMLDEWAPAEWIFGHYHVNKEFTVPGYRTKFRCVAELSTYEIDTEKNNGRS